MTDIPVPAAEAKYTPIRPLDRFLKLHASLASLYTLRWMVLPALVVFILIVWVLGPDHQFVGYTITRVLRAGLWALFAKAYFKHVLPGVTLTDENGVPNPWAYVLSAAVVIGSALVVS